MNGFKERRDPDNLEASRAKPEGPGEETQQGWRALSLAVGWREARWRGGHGYRLPLGSKDGKSLSLPLVTVGVCMLWWGGVHLATSTPWPNA